MIFDAIDLHFAIGGGKPAPGGQLVARSQVLLRVAFNSTSPSESVNAAVTVSVTVTDVMPPVAQRTHQ